MYRLIRHGYKAFLVGGGVRDLLLEKKPKDFDIGTDATPNQVKSLFGNCRIIGRRFKLAHVFFRGGKIIEVSTFRDASAPIDTEDAEDLEQFGPRGVRDNKYGDEETDAVRRDITINGLFYDLANFSVIDYVGGVADLRAKVVKMIGDPDIRIAEDPVRMIRALRHAARANFKVDPKLKEAILNNSPLILQSSPVRVYEEVKKDLCSGHCRSILTLLRQFSLLEQLWPELVRADPTFLSENDDLSQVLRRADSMIREGRALSPTLMLCLLSLFIISEHKQVEELHQGLSSKDDIAEKLRMAFSKLTVPKKERLRIEELVRLWLRVTHFESSKVKGASLARSAHFVDLVDLLDCLYGENTEHGWTKLIEEASLINRSRPQERTQRAPMHHRRGAGGRHGGGQHKDRFRPRRPRS